MARPKKLINFDRLRNAAASCGSMEDIAAALRMSPRTLFNAREANPEIDLVIAEARADTGQIIADKLIEAAKDGSVEAAKFILERKFQWHKTTKTEMDLSASPSIRITLCGPGSDELTTN